MCSSSSIGGYFELELQRGIFPHAEAILLNSGRACFEYILRTHNLEHVYMPKFTCDVMLEPLKKVNVKYSSYELTENLEIGNSIELKKNEMLLYINYFGIKDKYCTELSQKYGKQLILDCSQSFYYGPMHIGHTFYSPRKFFGVPDGGLLFTDTKLEDELPIDLSFQRSIHLLKRIDLGPEAGYADFKVNDDSLAWQPIKQMSRLTRQLLSSIDYETVKQTRRENFYLLHSQLRNQNELNIELNADSIPMVYPFLIYNKSLRRRLIINKIYVPTYWPNILSEQRESDIEYQLAKYILPLPIDQRYGKVDMDVILTVIMDHLKT